MSLRTSPSDVPGVAHPERTHPRDRYRGAFRISLAISAVFHLMAIALYPSFSSGIPEVGLNFGGYLQPLAPPGTELVNLVEVPPDQDPDAPAAPEEEPEPAAPVDPRLASPPGIDVPSGLQLPDRGPTAAEVLKPRAGDLRYWAPVSSERTALTEEEILRLRFIAQLEAANDSAALAAERANPDTDWTYTDEDGKTWGVSPGKIHLGDITLPMPFGFGASPMQRERAESRLWAWDAIERGAASGAVNNSWKERDRAIRERMNAERKPDTTRTGGGRGGGRGP